MLDKLSRPNWYNLDETNSNTWRMFSIENCIKIVINNDADIHRSSIFNIWTGKIIAISKPSESISFIHCICLGFGHTLYFQCAENLNQQQNHQPIHCYAIELAGKIYEYMYWLQFEWKIAWHKWMKWKKCLAHIYWSMARGFSRYLCPFVNLPNISSLHWLTKICVQIRIQTRSPTVVHTYAMACIHMHKDVYVCE